MPRRLVRLPNRFPAGTRYVVEGHRNGVGLNIVARYLELPNGKHLDLSLNEGARTRSRRRRGRQSG